MTREQWAALPVRLAAALVGAGVLVLAGMWYGAGEQRVVGTEMPYVLVACGVGVGLIATGCAVYAAHRSRLDRLRVENALARALLAADEYAARRR